MTDSNTSIVFVVDDDDDLRDAMRNLLEVYGFRVELFADAAQFLASYHPGLPGCLLLDIAMPGMTGLELQAELKARGIQIPIIFLTAHGDVSTAVKTVQQGAFDFLEKPVRGPRLLERVQDALDADRQARLLRDGTRSARENYARLSPREQQVLALVAAGLSSKMIARELCLSHRTIETHRASIMHKMGASNLAALVSMAAACSGERDIAGGG